MLTATMAHAEPSATLTTTTASSLSTRTQQEQSNQVQQPPTVAISLLADRRKTVYFTVGQRKEVAIFEDFTPSEEIKSKPTTHG